MKPHLFSVLFLVSFNVYANWEYITSDDIGNDFYVSSESIKSSGWNKRTAIELVNYSDNTKTSYKSGIVQQEYECNSYKIRMLSNSVHSELFGKGKTLARDSKSLPWQIMPKGSVANQTRDYVCSRNL